MYSWRSQFNFFKSLMKIIVLPHDGSKGNIQVRRTF